MKNPKKKLHVAIILDGNRRFAKRLMKEPWKGHLYGAEKVKSLFGWCKDFEINELTLYCLSLENLFHRPKKELEYLMNLFERELNNPENTLLIEKNRIKVKFIGETSLLNKKLQHTIKLLENKTKKYNSYKINFLIAYGGRQEIIKAVKKLIKSKKLINEKNLQKFLWINSSPDLIIRTGGEQRTSNFLPWQSVYSEWVFLNKMWPEFSKKDFKRALEEFYSRKRRFGR